MKASIKIVLLASCIISLVDPVSADTFLRSDGNGGEYCVDKYGQEYLNISANGCGEVGMLPKQCVEGAVFGYNELGESELVDCAKWENTDPEVAVAEDEAIEKNNSHVDLENVEIIEHEPYELNAYSKANLAVGEVLDAPKKLLYGLLGGE